MSRVGEEVKKIMKKQKRIIKSHPSTERLLLIRMNRMKCDMERSLRERGMEGWEWKVYG